MRRYPQGYVGIDHQTRGGDILAVRSSVHIPELTFGPELTHKLDAIRPELWYPIDLMLEMLEVLDQKLGPVHLRSVGYTIIQRFQAETLRRSFTNVHDLLAICDQEYHEANRGQDIGGWKLVSYMPGRAEMEKTTPHHCIMEEGILEERLRVVGVYAKITQAQCFRKGAPLCRYVIESKSTLGWGNQIF